MLEYLNWLKEMDNDRIIHVISEMDNSQVQKLKRN